MEIDIGPNGEGLQEAIRELSKGACKVKITGRKEQQRTLPQNAAIHKYCELLARALNDAGMERVKALQILRNQPDIEIEWTPEAIKEDLWRPVQLAIYPDKPSTKDLEKAEVSVVYEHLNRHTSVKLGVGINFPDRWGN